MSRKISRRNVLVGAGVAGAGLALAGGGYAAGLHEGAATNGANSSSQVIPFYGAHQAGIATAQQERLHFAAFDLITDQRADLINLLRVWTSAAAIMTSGRSIGEGDVPPHAPPPDTGEAVGLSAANLTVTIGFGPTVFKRDGRDVYGLASRRPAALVDLPPFRGDALDPSRSGGDLCVQACADDPQVAFHAVRNLARLGRGVVVMRWSQLGFGRTASTSRAQQTPRNLMGFKDGTDNLKSEDATTLNSHVWVGGNEDPAWMRGGSYVVARRIRMHLEAWDRDFIADQEAVIGRSKVSGAPLGKSQEFDTVDLKSMGPDGKPLIPPGSHVRLAIGDGSIKILRRGYSFTDGMDGQTGQLDAGLFFIAYQRDPRAQFIPLQQSLGQHDALNEYITHVGSGVFAVPPGASSGGFLGGALFAGL